MSNIPATPNVAHAQNPLTDYSQRFQAVSKRSIAPSTIASYDSQVRRFKAFYQKYGHEVDIDTVNQELYEVITLYLGFLTSPDYAHDNDAEEDVTAEDNVTAKSKRYKAGAKAFSTVEQTANALKGYFKQRGRTEPWNSQSHALRNPLMCYDIEVFLKGYKNMDAKSRVTNQATPILIGDMIDIDKVFKKALEDEKDGKGLGILGYHGDRKQWTKAEIFQFDCFFTLSFLLMTRMDELVKLNWKDIQLNLEKRAPGGGSNGLGRRYHEVTLCFRKTNQDDPSKSTDYRFFEYDSEKVVDPIEIDIFRKLNIYRGLLDTFNYTGDAVFPELSGKLLFI